MNIIPHQVSGIFVPQREDNGYINATALSKAHYQSTGIRRDVADWLRGKRTKETLNHLSSVTGIPVTELVQVFQGGEPSEQGTYIHPKLATRFGVWLSDDLGYKVENWVEDWLTTGKNPIEGSREVAIAFDVADRFSKLLTGLGINPAIAGLVGLNHIERVCPALAPAVEESRKLIGGANATESQYLTPTELGDRIGMKSRAVNTALAEAGLQVQLEDGKGKKKWNLTDEGKKYGIVFLASGQNNRWSGGQIKWLPTVLDVLNVQQSA